MIPKSTTEHQQYITDSSIHNNVVASNLPRIPGACLMATTNDHVAVSALAFTANGKYLFTGGHDRRVVLWNPFRCILDDSNRHDHRRRPPNALALQTYTSGINYKASAIHSVSEEVFLVATGNRLLEWNVQHPEKYLAKWEHSSSSKSTINAIASTSNGNVYLTANYDCTVALWDRRQAKSGTNKPLQVLNQAKDSVTDVKVVQDSYILSTSVDGGLRTYDLRKGLLTTDQFPAPLTCMAVMDDTDTVLLSCLNNQLVLWNRLDGKVVQTLTGHHTAQTHGIACDVMVDQRTCITGNDNTNGGSGAILYDLDHGTKVQRLYLEDNDNKTTAGGPTILVKAHPHNPSIVVTVPHHASPIVWAHDTSPWDYNSR